MKFVCLSDTHSKHEYLDIPAGDVLLHAGDFCNKGTLAEVSAFARWFTEQPHRHKIVIAGNHDFPLERQPEVAEPFFNGVHYLRDSSVTIDGIHIYGTPWQPRFYNWAFNLDRGPQIREKWQMIPDDTDLLITHGPLLGVGDRTSTGKDVGCEDLLDEVLTRIKPKYHVCGHIHEGRGIYQIGETTSVNASNLNVHYQLFPQVPIVFDWEAGPVSDPA